MRDEFPTTASEWIVRLDEGSLPPHAQVAFDRWLAEDPGNAAAFGRARMTALMAKSLNTSREARQQLAELRAMGSAYPRRWTFLKDGALAHMWASRLASGLAALLCVIGLSLWLIATSATPGTLGNRDIAATGINEISAYELPDGSKVAVNAVSTIRLDFTRDRRQVFLDNGEAFFDVRHDAKRPFYVTVGPRTVVVTGTQFNVKTAPDGSAVQIAVLEGNVEVNDDTGPQQTGPTQIALAAGDFVRFPGGQPAILGTIPANSIATWRTRRLHFDQATLSEVLMEVNLYSEKKLTLGDPRLGHVSISGYFKAGDTKSFLFSLQELYRISADDQGDELVLNVRPEPALQRP
jgi:transmembrane sensor